MTTSGNLDDGTSDRWPELTACLQRDYGVQPAQITRLALGADPYTTVYRVVDTAGAAYFLKLRSADFNLAVVAVPHWLAEQSIPQIIAPIPCWDGRLFAQSGASAVILYPFVGGSDGFAVPLQERHWVELGQTLRRIHAAALPVDLAVHIPCEDYSPTWRTKVREYVAGSDETLFGTPATSPNDAAAFALHAFLRDRRAAILDLVAQAEQLARVAKELPQELVLCHADIHAGNVLIGASGDFHVVDWDTITLAPRERDLMFIGGGIAGVSKQPREVELFYTGYGPCTIDTRLLAYYRFERIVQDIAAYSMQVLASTDAKERAGFLREVAGQFEPGGVVEIAWRTLPG